MFLKKLLLKVCRFFRGYPSLKLLFEEAREKKTKTIFIQPRIIIYKFIGAPHYILHGEIELWAEEVKGTYLHPCYEVLVKNYDNEDFYYKECEKAVQGYADKFRKKIIEEGFNTVTNRLIVQ